MSWFILVVLLSIGAVAITIGIVGRRVGTEPRCRVCDYNLTGIDLRYCPECGSSCSVSSVVRGTRKRRPQVALLGCAAFIIGCAGVTIRVGNVDLYSYSPFSLLHILAPYDLHALDELIARCRRGMLSVTQVQEATDLCLAAQEDNGRSIVARQKCVDLLEWLDSTGQLSADERREYYGHAIRDVAVNTDNQVLEDTGRIELILSIECVLPRRGLYVEVHNHAFSIDGASVDLSQWGFTYKGPTGVGTTTGHLWVFVDKPPGHYVVELSADIILHDGSGRPGGRKWTRELSYLQEVEVN